MKTIKYCINCNFFHSFALGRGCDCCLESSASRVDSNASPENKAEREVHVLSVEDVLLVSARRAPFVLLAPLPSVAAHLPPDVERAATTRCFSTVPSCFNVPSFPVQKTRIRSAPPSPPTFALTAALLRDHHPPPPPIPLSLAHRGCISPSDTS